MVDVPKTPKCYGLRYAPTACASCVFRPGCASVRFQSLYPQARVVPTLLPASTHSSELKDVLVADARGNKSRLRKARVCKNSKRALREKPIEELPEDTQKKHSILHMGRGVIHCHSKLSSLFAQEFRETVDGVQYLMGDEVVCTLRKFHRNGYRILWGGSLLRRLRESKIGGPAFRKTGEQNSKIAHRSIGHLKEIAEVVRSGVAVG